MRYLVTGASGLLGLNFSLNKADAHSIVGVVNQNPLGAVPFEVKTLDLSDPDVLEPLIDEVRPDVVLNCAAIANLEVCEKNPELAWKLNAELPGNLSKLALRKGYKLVHISTDAVFNGIKGEYREEDEVNPLSIYAETKYQGERKVAEFCKDAIIARVNFYGFSLNGRRSLVEFFINNLKAGREMKGFTDVYFCPLMVLDLADLLEKMVQHDLRGLYHVFSEQCLSKYDFGVQVARHFGFDENLIKPSSVNEGGLLAKRAPNLTMFTEKLSAALGEKLPGQAQGLDRLFTLYQSGYPQKLLSLGSI